jgi:hypothetical protein
VTLLAGALTIMLTVRGEAQPRSLVAISAWAAALAAVCGVAGRAGLGTLLAAAFVVQVAPSLWTAYRTARPSGISAGTWTLILGELLCFLVYGQHESDPRLIALGATGVTASALMLARIFWTRRLSGQARSTPADRESCDTRLRRPPAYELSIPEFHPRPVGADLEDALAVVTGAGVVIAGRVAAASDELVTGPTGRNR